MFWVIQIQSRRKSWRSPFSVKFEVFSLKFYWKWSFCFHGNFKENLISITHENSCFWKSSRCSENVENIPRNIWLIKKLQFLDTPELMTYLLFNSFMLESLSQRNQSIDLLCKSMGWFLYDRGVRHERVNILVFFRRDLAKFIKSKK